MDANTKRLIPSTVSQDRDVVTVLKNLTDYRPSSDQYSVTSIEAFLLDLDNKKAIRVQREADYKAARDNEVAAEHAFHQAVLGAKDQVRAQFGVSSNELQSIGLKKKTEYKSHSKKVSK